jgi:hypothetical protein
VPEEGALSVVHCWVGILAGVVGRGGRQWSVVVEEEGGCCCGGGLDGTSALVELYAVSWNIGSIVAIASLYLQKSVQSLLIVWELGGTIAL